MKQIFAKMLIVVLVVLFAAPPAFSAECSDLTLNVSNVTVKENAKASVTFYLINNSDERFYLDRVSAFDFAEGVQTNAVRWDHAAESFGSAVIVVGVHAEQTRGEKTAYLQVQGHFLNGKECYYYQLKSEFNVDVVLEQKADEEDNLAYCKLFSIDLPKNVYMEGMGTIDFNVNNYTTQDAKITITGRGATVETSEYLIPAKTIAEKKLIVASSNKQAQISFFVDLGACGKIGKTVYITNTLQRTIPSQAGNASTVDLNYTKSFEDGAYVLEIVLQNKSSQPVDGILYADVPKDWNSDSYRVFLAPFGMEKIKMRIKPGAGASGAVHFNLVFEYNNNQIKRKDVVITIGEKSKQFAGLFTLAITGILVGIIALLIIFGIGTVATRKAKKEIWMEGQL